MNLDKVESINLEQKGTNVLSQMALNMRFIRALAG
jgi:hypothetical protein